ncbi:MAG TPA: type II toxin-antitoxin system VapB family antitoxin [Caulobacterales bacterium]|nr:type II toxin-antitoxin system VapB family antitoxin [Caulobacterales bacterium]
MGLNIKNPEAERLIKELAELTGENQTAAVTEAVRERIARVKRRGLSDRLLEIGREFASRMSEETRDFDIDKDLYDKNGLPK